MGQAPALGYKSKAAFYPISKVASGLVWPTSSFPKNFGSIYRKANAYDLVPFKSESLKHDYKDQLDDTLDGNSGYLFKDIIAKMFGGGAEINGKYLGLDALIACAMGAEKIRTSNLESPAFGVSGNGAALTGTSAAGTTTDTLVTTGSIFASSLVGDWVRIQELVTSPQTMDQVRKVTTYTDANTLKIAPNWTTNPGASKSFAIAREFLHTFERSKNMHGELFSDVMSGQWATGNSTSYMTRAGVFVVDMGTMYKEAQYCMVNKMKIKLDANGLAFTFELIPQWVDHLNTSVQDSSLWGYSNGTAASPASGSSIIVEERIQLADHTFRLTAFGTGVFSSSHDLGVTEFEIELDNKLKGDDQTTRTGYLIEEPVRNAKCEIKGSFTIPRFRDTARLVQFLAETALMGSLTCVGSTIATGKTNEFKLWLRRLKLSSPEVVIGNAGASVEKWPFTTLMCDASTGSPSSDIPTPTSGLENGEIIIQTRNQNPFNAFMWQNVE